MKKDRIYKEIKQNIISGRLKEGEKLPTEFECMNIYSVSRDTVRGAFRLLENEGFIKRVKSKGTFIQLPDTGQDSKNIYFLVSCYEHLRYSSWHSLQIMFDLIAECAMVGWNLVPVIFSQTNSNTDIWWKNLERFNSNSKIVVSHMWFSTYFKKLSSLRSEVAFINNDAVIPENLQKYTKNWTHFIEQDSFAGEDAVRFLNEKKCRKIALIMNGLEIPFNTLRTGCSNAAKKYNINFCAMNCDDKSTDFNKIKEFYKQQKFDGLVLHINEYNFPHDCSLRKAIGIPENIPVVAIPNKSSSIFYDRHENIAVMEYKVRRMCHDIVSCLTSPKNKHQHFKYNPSVTEPPK